MSVEVPSVDLDTSVNWGIRPHVPLPEGVVHGVGEKVIAIRAEAEAGEGVGVTLEHHEWLIVASQVPHLSDENGTHVSNDRHGSGPFKRTLIMLSIPPE